MRKTEYSNNGVKTKEEIKETLLKDISEALDSVLVNDKDTWPVINVNLLAHNNTGDNMVAGSFSFINTLTDYTSKLITTDSYPETQELQYALSIMNKFDEYTEKLYIQLEEMNDDESNC